MGYLPSMLQQNLLATLLLCTIFSCSAAGPLDEARLVDLSHPFNADTVYWPTANGFALEHVARGPNDLGLWYASNDFAASEHGGTHLDAPLHFARGRRATAQIPLTQLVGPARVIDVSEACAADPDYLIRPEDVRAHEERHGRIEPGEAVLFRTGYGRFYPDRKRYLGDDRPGIVDELHFPGLSEEVANLLAERRVDLVGLDTASLDHGPSVEFRAHRVLAEANVPGLENLANLELLPARGAWILALPMKIEDGTGGPCRVVAVLP